MMKRKYCFYMHTGSGNHGCEAIVRSTSAILGEPIVLFTRNKDEDESYLQLPSIQFETTGNSPSIMTLDGLIMRLKMKGLKQKYAFVEPSYKSLIKNADANTVAFSIGGDNYCYDGMPEVLRILNDQLGGRGAKTILYGCSIEPELIQKPKIVDDLKKYSLIVPRESITYNALVEVGLEKTTILASDPAFTLVTKVNDDAEELVGHNTVGVNLSPLVLEGGNTILFEAYCRLIEWILESTDMNIALIPHVIWKGNDDRIPLGKLHELYAYSNRVTMIEDHNAMELKGYISKCRFFVGARTHATIAAYSSNVPTLVAGYSVKSKGIAKDIFGTDTGYVVDTKNIQTDQALVDAFSWIYKNEENIREHLSGVMPRYINAAYNAVEAVRRI